MALNLRGDGIPNVDNELDAPELKNMGQFLTNHTVDIFFGTGRKKFHLHRDSLCDRLNYFTACSTVRFEEAQQKQLFLPDDDIEGFDLLVKVTIRCTLKKTSSDNDLPVYLALEVFEQHAMFGASSERSHGSHSQISSYKHSSSWLTKRSMYTIEKKRKKAERKW
ncbi:hypothetical protein HO173_007616 [Letharia columbiana]|uniref:BTB domain-containing protein n=1 Tax=Letharia columbiana TaxID=112416 RepID=A0A8H6L3H0_9LECA|nr:uncharacterized protein HO173_007616 [Letharia columbiana]KAF6234196.1 hypothetical protein HO173_007616 [Letharia columbiana]